MLQQHMKTVLDQVELDVFQPTEKADLKYKCIINDVTKGEIGKVTISSYGTATLNWSSYLTTTEKLATLSFQSQDGSPISLPPSYVSEKLYSPLEDVLLKCDINQAQQGKYNISFTTPSIRGEHQLIVQVGGVDIAGSPFILPLVEPLPKMRGKPLLTITGLNKPYGITLCDSGEMVVVEGYSDCITIVNKEGRRVRSFGTSGTKEGEFTKPRGVAISNDGHILVTDEHQLQKLTFNGFCVKSISSSESGSAHLQFNYPSGIAVHLLQDRYLLLIIVITIFKSLIMTSPSLMLSLEASSDLSNSHVMYHWTVRVTCMLLNLRIIVLQNSLQRDSTSQNFALQDQLLVSCTAHPLSLLKIT